MSKKKIVLLLAIIFVFTLKINVSAYDPDAVCCCGGTRKTGRSCGGTNCTSGECPTSTDDSSESSSGSESTPTSSGSGTYCCPNGKGGYENKTTKGTGCSNSACVTCCVSGSNKTKTSCAKGERSGGCIDTDIAFSNEIKKLSYPNSHPYTFTGSCTGDITVDDNNDFVSSSEKTVTINKSPTGTTCPTVTVTATRAASNTCTEKSVKTTFVAYSPWGDGKDTKMDNLTNDCTSKYNYSQAKADEEGKNEYRTGCKNIKGACRCVVYKRGCGSSSRPTPSCYIDPDGYMRWGVYTYTRKACTKNKKYIVCTGASGETPVVKADCKSEPVCDTTTPTDQDNSTPCNGLGNNSGDYNKYCKLPVVFNSNNTAEEKYFYNITCKEGIYTEFKGPVYDWKLEESNNAYLYPATGFKYMLRATSRLYCEGTFDNTLYEKYLDYIKKYSAQLKTLSDDDDEKANLMAKTLAADFSAKVAKSYIEWDPKYTFDPNVVITDPVAQANGEEPYSVELVKNKATSDKTKNTWVCGELIKDTNVKIKDDYKIDFGGRKKKANFVYDLKQRVEKIVPEACLDPDTGKISYGGTCSEDYSLGAQFFISSDRKIIDSMREKKQPYNYTVDVTEMGFAVSSSSHITNKTQCRLEVLDNQIIYRHVDPNDPFLQKTEPGRAIGLNWKNSRYDFTKIINMDTWHTGSLYHTIRLNPDRNRVIKSLTNDNNASVYYVRGCKNNRSLICELVNSAKKGTR